MEETKKSAQLKAGEMILLAVFAAVAVVVMVLAAAGALTPEQKPGDAPEMSQSQSAEASDAALLDYWSAGAEQKEDDTAEEPQSTVENAVTPEQETAWLPDIPAQPVSEPEEETHSDNYGGAAEVVDTQSRVEWTEGWD